jgi:hypothetical protein
MDGSIGSDEYVCDEYCSDESEENDGDQICRECEVPQSEWTHEVKEKADHCFCMWCKKCEDDKNMTESPKQTAYCQTCKTYPDEWVHKVVESDCNHCLCDTCDDCESTDDDYDSDSHCSDCGMERPFFHPENSEKDHCKCDISDCKICN